MEGLFFSDPNNRTLIKQTLIVNLATLCIIFSFWTFYSQLIPLAVVQFGLNTNNIYNCYIPIGVAFGVSSLLMKRIPKTTPIVPALVVGILVQIGGFFFFLEYSSSSSSSSEPLWILYVGAGIITFGFNVYNILINTFYSKIVASNKYITSFIMMLVMTGSLGRFLGPFWVSFVLTTSGPDTCCNHEEFEFSCCTLDNINVAFPIAMVVACIGLIITIWYFKTIPLVEDEEIDDEKRVLVLNDEYASNPTSNASSRRNS